jgi:hypothetical protein
MKIKTEHKVSLNAYQSRAFIVEDNGDPDSWDRKLEISDLAWEDTLYISLWSYSGEMVENIIIRRKDLEKFLKQARKNAKQYKEDNPAVPISVQLRELPIGTRFITTTDGNEFIKVGEDYYIETNEKLMMNGQKGGLGFLNAENFDPMDDYEDVGEIVIVSE